MKKLSLAAAIGLIAASSAVNSATVYEKDGFKFKVDGDIQIQLRQRVGTNKDVGVDFDDSELKNKISYDLGNGLTGFAEAHFDNGKDSAGAVESEETFVGLKTDTFKVQVGRMDYATDEFATERGIEEPLNQSAFEAGVVDGRDVILLEANTGAIDVLFSHDFGGDSGSNNSTDLESSDLYLSAQVNDTFSIGFAAQDLKRVTGAKSSTTTGVNAKIKAGSVDIAADYSKTDSDAVDNNGAADTDRIDLKVTNLSVRFPVAPTTKVSLGLTNQSNAANTADDGWYANAVYKFPQAKKVSVFGEIQDTNATNADIGFLVGMRVKF